MERKDKAEEALIMLLLTLYGVCIIGIIGAIFVCIKSFFN